MFLKSTPAIVAHVWTEPHASQAVQRFHAAAHQDTLELPAKTVILIQIA